MNDEVRFRAGLFHGAAGYYDQYRLPYPDAMLTDLIQRAQVPLPGSGGRLLDLACGTGQLTFPLRRWFTETWAVDQEPDMTATVRAKAADLGATDVHPVVADAEALTAEPGSFDLAVCGNAFHRLDRDLVASRLFGWLKPGGCVALAWSSQPWNGEAPWQRALAALLERWRTALGAQDRIPANWDLPRQRRPDIQVLAGAGFEPAADRGFTVGHRWTLAGLGGLIRSTSFLPAAVLGSQGEAFDGDLAATLSPLADDGTFPETLSFSYELARKPA